MNDVPPSQEPSDDDIDTLYRRASALDPSRPSAGLSRAILAHAAQVSADRVPPRDSASTKVMQARTRRTWWRPAVFGTLAAAVLAGLFVLPNVRTSYLAPKTYAPAMHQETLSTPAAPSPSSPQSSLANAPTSPISAPSSAAASAAAPSPAPASLAEAVSPQTDAAPAAGAALRAPGASTAAVESPPSPDEATSARATESYAAAPPRTDTTFARSTAATPAPAPAPVPPAAPAARDKQSPTEALASRAAGQLAAPTDAAKAAPTAKASRKSKANEPATNSQQSAAAEAKDLQPPLVDITVTAQRRTQNDMATPSPVASVAADSLAEVTSVAPPDIVFSSPARLHLAAERGDLKTLQAALDQLTDINSRDESGRTALLLATLHGQTKAVRALLAHGADPNIADANGMTPLQAATSGGKSAIIDALKGAGAH